MKPAIKWLIKNLLIQIVVFITIVGSIVGYNRMRDSIFKEGYDRGMGHARNYYHQFNRLPSKSWQDKYWKYTNQNDGWIFEP